MLKDIHVPGAIWFTILAAMLMTLQDQINLQFPGADWLPIAIALIGYAAKWAQVNSQGTEDLPELPPPGVAATPHPAPQKPSTGRKIIQFLLG